VSHTHWEGEREGESRTLAEFRAFRERMNKEILDEGNPTVNRFFALDGRAYEAGALDVRTKELLGLVTSMVLRCDDCVTYHLTDTLQRGGHHARPSRRDSLLPLSSAAP
jgi:AhpD family alkylhydroperoxidase